MNVREFYRKYDKDPHMWFNMCGVCKGIYGKCSGGGICVTSHWEKRGIKSIPLIISMNINWVVWKVKKVFWGKVERVWRWHMER